MQNVRQLASGLLYAFVSLLLVIGGLSLSLAQGGSHATAPSAQATRVSPTTIDTLSPTFAPTMASTASPPASPTATSPRAIATSTYFFPTVAKTARPTSTSARPCGPPSGWIRAYVVQPGDTLYRIATTHGVTVRVLQRANCKFGTLIYAGEILWVPFVLPPATELTIIPTFDTPTEPAGAEASATPMTDVAITQDP